MNAVYKAEDVLDADLYQKISDDEVQRRTKVRLKLLSDAIKDRDVAARQPAEPSGGK